MSRSLIQATTDLAHQARQGLEAGGVKAGERPDSAQIVLIPGDHLDRISQAMQTWTRLSCDPSQCDHWDAPAGQAAARLYSAVEAVFTDQTLRHASPSHQTRSPVQVDSQAISTLWDAQDAWIEASRPRRSLSHM